LLSSWGGIRQVPTQKNRIQQTNWKFLHAISPSYSAKPAFSGYQYCNKQLLLDQPGFFDYDPFA